LSVAIVIDRHVTGTYTVTRADTPTFTGGMVGSRSESNFTIDAHVQPASGQDVRYLLEGKTVTRALWVWTRTALRTGGGGEEPDRITIDGDVYEVSHLENWSSDGPFYKAMVLKL